MQQVMEDSTLVPSFPHPKIDRKPEQREKRVIASIGAIQKYILISNAAPRAN